jgi:methyl-accepting chemotaxis protein
MKNSIASRIWLLVCAASVALAILGGFAIWGAQRMSELGEDLYRRDFADLSFAAKVTLSFREQMAVVGRAPSELDLARLERDRLTMATDIDLILQLIETQIAFSPTQDEKELLTELRDGVTDFGSQAAKVFEFAALFAQENAVEHLNGPLAASADFVNELLDRISLDADRRAARKVQDVARAADELPIGVGVTLILMVLSVGLGSLLLSRSIIRPLDAITRTIEHLAAHETDLTVPATGRTDEIGKIARAVEVFKQTLIETKTLHARERAEQAAKVRQERAMNLAIEQFSATVSARLATVAEWSQAMLCSADVVKETSAETRAEIARADAAATDARRAVGDVGTALADLETSMDVAAQQVSSSTTIAGTAVCEADASSAKVRELVEAAARISSIVDLIRNIAQQTNLLALNATIEAARAGAVGKGFAVVANEVKALASQTRSATEDVGQQIAQVEAIITETARSIGGITGTIGRINTIAGEVAQSFDEQRASRDRIGGCAESVARGADRVVHSIVTVRSAAEMAGNAAAGIETMARSLTDNTQDLKREIEGFLVAVRNSNERRRFLRVDVDLATVATCRGQEVSGRTVNMSAGGALFRPKLAAQPGDGIDLHIDGIGSVCGARIAAVGEAGTHIQFPYDDVHLARVEAFLDALRAAA